MIGLAVATVLVSEFIYDRAPFPSCHAATVVETRKGTVLTAWFGGTHESHPDVAIYLSRREANGWSEPMKVADGVVPGDRDYACYNPVLFQPKLGPLLLYYKVGTGPQTWWGMVTTSVDDGRHWSKPIRLPAGIYGPIKNKPIELADGTIMCGSSEEANGWQLHMEFSPDGVHQWSRTRGLNDPRLIGAIQPSLLPLGGRRIRAVGRTQQGKVFAIDSEDLGHTWGPMRLLDVPNPNSGTDAVRLQDGRYLMVFNNTPSGRTPLNVAISDDAEHWQPLLTLESERGEYSYPSVMQSSDGLVHIVYTWRRERIRYRIISL